MASDWLRIAELVSRYWELALGTVDGSVVATPERLQITKIATLDRLHCFILRPRPHRRVRTVDAALKPRRQSPAGPPV